MLWAHRLSVIPRALVDRSNPPPDSDDDEGDECIEYDVYGWFKFESDADGVQRLDRQWVPLHDLEQAEGWEAAVLDLIECLPGAHWPGLGWGCSVLEFPGRPTM